MKGVKFLLALFVAATVFASCATTQSVTDDELDGAITRRVGDRVYVQDPYNGTVILERDPFTGRYYDVTYGAGFGYYPYPYSGWNNRIYRGYNRPLGYNHYNSGSVQRPSQPSGVTREDARRKVLGH